ncbi:glycosyltransferase [Candidatus Woesearchaeota archaeon]|nr:glycosyltransferase [Candidatus Woesearchaeota archaeon]
MLLKTAQIEICTKCNLDCKICLPKSNLVMKYDYFREIINSMKSLNSVTLQGLGEPFLNPDIYRMLKLLEKKRILARIVTNGYLLEPYLISQFSPAIFSDITFSIDSYHSQGLPFKEYFTRIFKKAIILKRNNFSVVIHIVFTKDNISSCLYIIKQAIKNKINVLLLTLLYYKERYLSPYDMKRLVRNFLKQYNIYTGNKYIRFASDLSCCWGFDKIYVGIDGKIAPCCRLFDMDFGDCSASKIRLKKTYVEFKNDLVSGKMPALCKNCEWFPFKAELENNPDVQIKEKGSRSKRMGFYLLDYSINNVNIPSYIAITQSYLTAIEKLFDVTLFRSKEIFGDLESHKEMQDLNYLLLTFPYYNRRYIKQIISILTEFENLKIIFVFLDYNIDKRMLSLINYYHDRFLIYVFNQPQLDDYGEYIFTKKKTFIPFNKEEIEKHRIIKDSNISLCFCGRMIKEKNPITAIRLAEIMKLKAYLITKIGNYGKEAIHSKNVEYLGPITGPERFKYISRAHFLINLSTFENETFGKVNVEAMACGCVPVVSDLKVFDYVTDGTNGIKIPLDRINDIRYIKKKILSQIHNYEKIRTGGLITAERYSDTLFLEQLMDDLDEKK